MSEKAVVILSGGLDSTVLLYHCLAEGLEVHPLAVDYGQKHKKEIGYALHTCDELNLELEIADLTGITKLISNSSQTSDAEVPTGRYDDASMKLTVVPNRNMIMLSVAGGYAINLKAGRLYYGAHGGDHAIYPDCRDTFVDPLRQALANADWHEVVLLAPFTKMTKADIVTLGAKLNVPFNQTWSCYVGGKYHCGRCGTCQERAEAFQLAGVDDPTIYQTEDAEGEVWIGTQQTLGMHNIFLGGS